MAFLLFLISFAAMHLLPGRLPVFATPLLAVSVLVLCLFGFYRPRNRLVYPGLLILWFILSGFWGNLHFQPFNRVILKVPKKMVLKVWGTIDGKVYQMEDKVRFVLAVDSYALPDDREYPSKEKLWVQARAGSMELFYYGSKLRMQGRIRALRSLAPFDQRLRTSGIAAKLYVFEVHRSSAPLSMIEHLNKLTKRTRDRMDTILENISVPAQIKAMMRAMVFGEKSFLDPGLRESLQHLNIMHIFAISGLHFGGLAWCLNLLLRLTGLQRPQVHLLSIPILFLFLSLVQFPPSACRAFLMLSLYYLAPLFGRHVSGLQVIGITGILLLFWNPGYASQPGFILSFAAVIALLGPGREIALTITEKYFKKEDSEPLTTPRPVSRRMAYWTVMTFVYTQAAWLGTLPLVLYYFKGFSPWSLLLNPVAILAVQGALPCTLASLFFGGMAPALGYIPAMLAGFCFKGLLVCIEGVRHMPFYYLPVHGIHSGDVIGMYGIGFICYRAWWSSYRFQE